ncbi:MAG TPA: TldD/PmbA family protein [Egibacteraceae bacterium]|nr:TldD/PmbA family protein [Egibacteraceae bacterium]HVM14586.1 TldD/PmbA family protein [Egibacteraceae bacterium]HVM19041.1 TldD/PmbA family protein [Egibacteraceae bacterium]
MSQDDLLTLLDRVVDRATNGELVEAYGIDQTETTVKAYGGDVESLSSAQTRGVGIRVIVDGGVGYAYTADTSEAALAETLEEARVNASVATADPANVLAEPGDQRNLDGLYDPRFTQVAADDKVGLALALEAAATAADEIKGVDSATYGDSDATVAICSTAGVRGAYRRCDAYLGVEVLAERDGTTTSAYGLDLRRVAEDLDVDAAAREAVERAVRLLGGRKPASAPVPVVLDPYATAAFLGVLAAGLTADAVQKGRSLFAGHLGESIAPAHVTLVDDGTLVEGPGAAPWDAEGVPSGRTPLIEGGVLQGWLHNCHTAARDATSSTGNASRSGFKATPGVSPTNLFLQPGTADRDALLRQAGTGFYCQQIMGVHSGADPVSGEFSVGAAGVMIRDGAFAEPVREATIAGTIPQMLSGIVAVGADLRWLPFGGGMGGTTVLIDGMTLAGA